MKNKIYIAPEAKVIILYLPSIMAASYIGEGKTDGQGHGQFDAPAKRGTQFFDKDEEENIITGW